MEDFEGMPGLIMPEEMQVGLIKPKESKIDTDFIEPNEMYARSKIDIDFIKYLMFDKNIDIFLNKYKKNIYESKYYRYILNNYIFPKKKYILAVFYSFKNSIHLLDKKLIEKFLNNGISLSDCLKIFRIDHFINLNINIKYFSLNFILNNVIKSFYSLVYDCERFNKHNYQLLSKFDFNHFDLNIYEKYHLIVYLEKNYIELKYKYKLKKKILFDMFNNEKYFLFIDNYGYIPNDIEYIIKKLNINDIYYKTLLNLNETYFNLLPNETIKFICTFIDFSFLKQKKTYNMDLLLEIYGLELLQAAFSSAVAKIKK